MYVGSKKQKTSNKIQKKKACIFSDRIKARELNVKYSTFGKFYFSKGLSLYMYSATRSVVYHAVLYVVH